MWVRVHFYAVVEREVHITIGGANRIHVHWSTYGADWRFIATHRFCCKCCKNSSFSACSLFSIVLFRLCGVAATGTRRRRRAAQCGVKENLDKNQVFDRLKLDAYLEMVSNFRGHRPQEVASLWALLARAIAYLLLV